MRLTPLNFKTLGQFIIEKQKDFPYSKGELSRLLRDIGIAAKVVNNEVNKAGLKDDIIGAEGSVNVQGEQQMKLDIFANDQFKLALKAGGECCAVISEEEELPTIFEKNEHPKQPKYIVVIDPLDGSSNIDVNVSVGTIFSIFRRVSSESDDINGIDLLQKGVEQVAAGYVIYGTSTILVYTTGNGVNGFTFNPSIGEFCLSHPNMKTPQNGIIYSINEGNYYKFPAGIKKYIKYCQEKDVETKRPYTSRYIGSFVADFHRNLLKGGLYIYPQTDSHPNGKLRLMCECNPLAWICEQAGGKATTGSKRILDIKPKNIHDRVPIIIGSKNMVEKVEKFLELDNNTIPKKV